MSARRQPRTDVFAEIGQLAAQALRTEVETWPKPGLVSLRDSGAHSDMDAATMLRGIAAIEPFLVELAVAGGACADMNRLRAVGLAAERAMLSATGGVNTHRGAIFGLGLLAAAAGFRSVRGNDTSLGVLVAQLWGAEILAGPITTRVHPTGSHPARSHGAQVAQHYGAGGAKAEAAAGFPSLYRVGRPALRDGHRLAPNDPGAARVQACMALIAQVEDTNLLVRGGPDGLRFAQAEAQAFLEAGGVGAAGWCEAAAAMHRRFVDRRLSPGGCADLLAMAIFAEEVRG